MLQDILVVFGLMKYMLMKGNLIMFLYLKLNRKRFYVIWLD